MTTVAQLIEYLQTLPQDTTVKVAVAVEGYYGAYTSWEDLDLPRDVAEGFTAADFSDNMDFYGRGNDPWLCLGRV